MPFKSHKARGLFERTRSEVAVIFQRIGVAAQLQMCGLRRKANIELHRNNINLG